MKWNTVQAKPICIFFFSQLASNEMPNVKNNLPPKFSLQIPKWHSLYGRDHLGCPWPWQLFGGWHFHRDQHFLNSFSNVLVQTRFSKTVCIHTFFPHLFCHKKKNYGFHREKGRKGRREGKIPDYHFCTSFQIVTPQCCDTGPQSPFICVLFYFKGLTFQEFPFEFLLFFILPPKNSVSYL